MQETRDICETVFENGAAVLMARIVDGAGVVVRPDDVARVYFSIREIDPVDPMVRHDVAGFVRVRLRVGDVFLDRLETGRLWRLDVAGYNFRHVIRARRDNTFPKRGARYEIRYRMWPIDCAEPESIRFHVRFKPK
jgi:hypothetical protein